MYQPIETDKALKKEHIMLKELDDQLDELGEPLAQLS